MNIWMTWPEPPSKKRLVKLNMLTFQTMVEAYAVDWDGEFSLNTVALKKEGSMRGREYWREFANPYTGRSGRGWSYQLESQAAEVGIVTYDPIVQGGKVVRYYIYGYDHQGKRIQDIGKDFFLTNS